MNYELRIKNKYKAIFFVSLLIIHYSLFIIPAHAQYGFTNFLGNAPGGQYDIKWFFKLLNNLACYFIQFAIIAFGVMLVVYGLMFLKSRGTPQGMTDSKKALAWGLVGGLVIFSVFTIILSVASILGANYPIIQYLKCS